MRKAITNLIEFMEGAEEQTDERTIQCPNCDKIIYKNERCSCQKTEVPKWMPDIKKQIPDEQREH